MRRGRIHWQQRCALNSIHTSWSKTQMHYLGSDGLGNSQMYTEICRGLDQANDHPVTTFTAITGEIHSLSYLVSSWFSSFNYCTNNFAGDGAFYSAGNDFTPAEWNSKWANLDPCSIQENLCRTAASKDLEIGPFRMGRRMIDHDKVWPTHFSINTQNVVSTSNDLTAKLWKYKSV